MIAALNGIYSWLPVIAVCSLVLFTASRFKSSRHPPLAPGPRRLPILGNLNDLPNGFHWLWYLELAKRYGDLVSLKFGTVDVLLLTKVQHARELFEKRGAIYSSRKRMIYYSDYQSNSKRFGLLPHVPAQKLQRRAMMQMLVPREIAIYKPWALLESKRLCINLLKQPEDFVILFKEFTMNTTHWLAYGFPGNRPKLEQVAYIARTQIEHMSAGAHLVDSFPVLDWLPDILSPWRATAKAAFTDECKFYSDLVDEVRMRQSQGKGRICMASKLLDRQEELQLSDVDIAFILGQVFEGGTDTTAATLHVFSHAMVMHPHIMKKAQAEIDSVCGDRSPTIHDDVPYMRCIVKEVMRWRSVGPNGFPHVSDKDDEYLGYHIPAGTLIFPVTHIFHHDEERYPNPDEFNPDRFKDDKSAMTEGHFSFGFGRRDCPGMHMAVQAMYISMMQFIANFDIKPATDAKTGIAIPIHQNDYTGSVIGSQPKPFLCSITPRSSFHRQRMLDDWLEAEVQYGL